LIVNIRITNMIKYEAGASPDMTAGVVGHSRLPVVV